MDNRIQISSPAKVNLFLRICGKRADGYHEIESLMCPVDLYDTITLETGGQGIRIVCPSPGIPEDETNLAHKAAALFYEELGREPGLVIALEKRIPAGAGLGGGSGNAANVLKGLNRLEGAPFSQEDLAAMGARIGADVPFFVYGRSAWISGIGEYIDPVSGLYPHHLVIVFPAIEASTARVYKKCNLALTRCKKIHRVPVLTGVPAYAEDLLCNDLETPALDEYPGIREARAALEQTDASGVLMSGSGSSVFGLFRERSQAMRAQERIQSRNDEWQVFTCQLIV